MKADTKNAIFFFIINQSIFSKRKKNPHQSFFVLVFFFTQNLTIFFTFRKLFEFLKKIPYHCLQANYFVLVSFQSEFHGTVGGKNLFFSFLKSNFKQYPSMT